VKRIISKEKILRIEPVCQDARSVGSDLGFRLLNFTLSFAVTMILLFGLCHSLSYAQSKIELKNPGAKKAESPQPKFNVGDFNYTSSNKRDPFEVVSLLRDIKQLGKNDILKKGYELEELKLVGIMKTINKNIAIMEDMQGKGILFKKKDYLNKNLWIVDILTDKVEFGYKIKGEIRTFAIDIPRKKEGM